MDMASNTSSIDIRDEDIETIVVGIARNLIGRDLVWDWFRFNWISSQDKFTECCPEFASEVIKACTEDFNKESELKEIQVNSNLNFFNRWG